MSDSKVLVSSAVQTSERDQLTAYDVGMAAASACQADQRFSYSLYVPRHFLASTPSDFRLMVVVHGTDRPNQKMLMGFQKFADENNFIVVAPLFPARIGDPNDMDNYKYILFQDIRFDLLLLSMLEEVGLRYGIEHHRFALFGFSGGAHFAHRFLILHPELLASVSIAAPGSVTLIDDASDWWVGIANVEQLFGKKIDMESLRKVPVHLVVGAEDTNTAHITHSSGSSHWMNGANRAGITRIERLQTLADNLRNNGVEAELEILPGIGHEQVPLEEAANRFFRRLL